MTQWENLPEPVPERPLAPITPAWSGFTADPRLPANQDLRASNADRTFATQLLEQARSEGRLDSTEYTGRAGQVATSRTLGELAVLVSDVMVASAARSLPDQAPRRVRAGMIRGWVGLAMLFNAIWLITVVTTGHLLYYWPIWPMLGTSIPVVMALMAGTPSGTPHSARHDERHAARDQRRGLRRGDAPPPAIPPGEDLR